MNGENLNERDLRQRGIVPPEQLAECRTTVVGVGAIGRQVALQLAAMGARRLQLIDPDVVEPVNLAAQGYLEDDLGRRKVQATADLCRRFNSGLDVNAVPTRFRRSLEVGNVLFCCVDRIETRRHVWESVKHRVDVFADGRMAGEVLRILVAADPASQEHYPTTLFAPGEAFEGSCTARSTIFCASIAAGLMVSQFSRWLRRLQVEADVTLNLLAGEMNVR